MGDNKNNNSKEPIKIKLSTVVLIIIIIMAFWIYELVQKNNNTSEQVNQLTNQIEALESEKNISNNELEENNTNTNSVENTSNASNVTELDINSSVITELYAKLLQSNYIYEENSENSTWDYYGSFYKDTKITANNLTNAEKIVAVLQYIEDSPSSVILSDEAPADIINHSEIQTIVNIYSLALIEDAKEEIFGSSVTIDWKDFDNGVGGNWYYYNDCYYYDEGAGGGFGCGISVASIIEKAEKFDDEIYIYDKFVYAETATTGEYSVYTSSDKTTLLDSGEDYESDNILDEDKLIVNYEDQAQTYKHTFKKASDGTYYWDSTEPVDE